ncbi:MAG: HAD family hydrolase [Sulfurospirillum sp.]|nr:HAD family hydrolase [Sulfurospirillum sp.]
MIKAVIFDLDGTLLDTLEDIALSANFVLEQFAQKPIAIDAYRFLVGSGAFALMQAILPQGDERTHKRALKIFETHYVKQFTQHSKLYADIGKLLSFLQINGIKLAILSNKPNKFTKMCAIKYLQNWHFEAVYGIREGIAKKPDPNSVLQILEALHVDVNEALFVGDTKIDMQTATNAKMRSIGVLWGFRDKDELLTNGATHIVTNPLECIKLIKILKDKNAVV